MTTKFTEFRLSPRGAAPIMLIGALVALILVALLSILAIAGCSRPINRTAERRIRDALPEILGPAKSYRVHVEGAIGQSIEGKIGSITIDGDSVQLPNGFLVDNLHLVLKNVDYDTDKGVVKSIGGSHFVITVGEKALDEYLAGEEPEDEPIKSLQISLKPGNSVSINAKRLVLGVEAPFRISGSLHIPNPTRLEFDPKRLTVVGLPITGKLLRFITNKIETSIDLTGLGVPVTLESVSTGLHTLELDGSIDIAALLQRQTSNTDAK